MSVSFFDTVIPQFPDLNSCLAEEASIVSSCCFETGVVKLQLNQNSHLTYDEKEALQCLLVNGEHQHDEHDDIDPLYLAEIAKKRIDEARGSGHGYMDTRFLVPTSNDSERIFSVAPHVSTDYRKSMTPVHMELLMFLYATR